jgi:general secretion pathway protein J
MLPVNAKIGDLSNFSSPIVLMRAPYRAVFSYAGPDRIWRNSWRDESLLPAAIRVSIRDAATERTLTVSTATVLHVGASAECAWAKVVRDCLYPPAKIPGNSL